MKCEQCKFDLPKDDPICPVCGTNNAEQMGITEENIDVQALTKRCCKCAIWGIVFLFLGIFILDFCLAPFVYIALEIIDFPTNDMMYSVFYFSGRISIYISPIISVIFCSRSIKASKKLKAVGKCERKAKVGSILAGVVEFVDIGILIFFGLGMLGNVMNFIGLV